MISIFLKKNQNPILVQNIAFSSYTEDPALDISLEVFPNTTGKKKYLYKYIRESDITLITN